nr:unnamed protein product [Digitaria exilis]
MDLLDPAIPSLETWLDIAAADVPELAAAAALCTRCIPAGPRSILDSIKAALRLEPGKLEVTRGGC